MSPRSSKTREDHFSLFSDLKFTSVKISNNALNFLLAQYRAIFKRAYIKGIASAVILTAGLAAGQAQATPSATDPIWTNDGSTWTINSGSAVANFSGSPLQTSAARALLVITITAPMQTTMTVLSLVNR